MVIGNKRSVCHRLVFMFADGLGAGGEEAATVSCR